MGARVAAVADRAIFVGNSKNVKLYRTGALAAGMDIDRIEELAPHTQATQLLRDSLEEGDVVLTNGRWQQALARVGLALTGRDVKCRVDPCPFKQMLCDVCPFWSRTSPVCRRRRERPSARRALADPVATRPQRARAALQQEDVAGHITIRASVPAHTGQAGASRRRRRFGGQDDHDEGCLGRIGREGPPTRAGQCQFVFRGPGSGATGPAMDAARGNRGRNLRAGGKCASTPRIHAQM